ncbi:unnamed protein product [Paramecium sonneborni]|uniref:CRC domain-containing protein n=1 Tax=Paramecium sonneborni TaxID=65129 RepID=A0A8S1RAV7_9CILI|nr:unnamed protein product [Paramecium sonneborni]
MNQFSSQSFVRVNSSAEIEDRISLLGNVEVYNEEENSSQPQLKYIMSQNSPVIIDEPVQNISKEEIHMNSTEQKLNNSFQNDLQIQSYKQPNDNTNYYNKNEQKRPLRTRRKINLNSSTINFQSDNNSSSQNICNNACKCTKSNCLKLYCQCFHQNQNCSDICKCIECKNRLEHLEIRFNALEKIKQKLHRQKNDDDLFDRSKIWGCKCQKSQCQKNYCECFLRKQKCSSNCRCKDCANKKRFPFQQKKKQKR